MLDRMVVTSPVGKHTAPRVLSAASLAVAEDIHTCDASQSTTAPSSSSSSSSYDAILRDVKLLKIRASASLGVDTLAGVETTRANEDSDRRNSESGGACLSMEGGKEGDDPPTPLAAFSVPTFRSHDNRWNTMYFHTYSLFTPLTPLITNTILTLRDAFISICLRLEAHYSYHILIIPSFRSLL